MANEGIRISVIVAHLKSLMPKLGDSQRELLRQALALGEVRDADAGNPRLITAPRGARSTPESAELDVHVSELGSTAHVTTEHVMVSDQRGTVRITVPLEITVRIGEGDAAPAIDAAPRARLAVRRTPAAAEAMKLDRDYENRAGFDETFIPGQRVPLPEVGAGLKSDLAPLRATEDNAKGGVLLYEHFSVVLSRSKRIALFTATNVDGATYLKVDRDTGQVSGAEGEVWYKDPRTSDAFYLGQDFYSAWSHYFDRGHLTRRTDPTWGDERSAERANADTFHFSNCSPQHFRFNQTARYWQGLERYVLENGVLSDDDNRRRICVMQGPIFDAENDYWCDDVQIPSSYWKVVVWKAPSGLKAVGLIADQAQLMNETRRFVGTPTDLPSVDVSQWRVAIATIEKRTKLSFGQALRDADSFAQAAQPEVGAEAAALRLKSLDDIKLGSAPGTFR
jgi:endonuclease G